MNKEDKISFFKENWKILLLTTVFGIIYLYRMFFNYPWYDELYTYYSFISRGPLYAAIHWPLPNNHVGYSVLSGFLSYFGNATIALRGVSFLASVFNIVLMYLLTKKLTNDEGLGLFSSVAFGTVILVHNLAIQGRGYAFSTGCFLIAIHMLIDVLNSPKVKGYKYVIYCVALFMGIYVLPSSTFWVFPLSLVTGISLIIAKKYKELIRFIIASLIAAFIDVFLYVVIWLAIGSNLLSKTADSGYFGIYQLDIIKTAPIKAAQRGLDYMLASPYIQSMDRDIVVRELFKYLHNLFDQFYPRMGYVLIAYLTLTFVVSVVRVLKDKNRVLELLVAVGIFMVPFLLVVQSTQPYLRVFSFFAVIVALSFVMYLKMFNISQLTVFVITVVMFSLLFTGTYNIDIADRENDIHDALIELENNGHSVSEISNILYVDDYQKYVIKFYYDAELSEVYSFDEAKWIMLPTEEINGVWPMLFAENDFDREEISKEYEEIVCTEKYIIYKKSQEN